MTNEEIISELGGEEFCDDELALAELLRDEIIFCNTREFVSPFSGRGGESTVVLFVRCNDIFTGGGSDGETFTTSDIAPLYKMHAADKRWGAAKWCCLKRNEQPQRPVAEAMKKDGAWDEQMEALPANYYDNARREAKQSG